MLKKVIVAGLLIGIVLIFCTGLRAQLELPPNAAGVIPVSLIYWELTGDKSMLEAAIGEQ